MSWIVAAIWVVSSIMWVGVGMLWAGILEGRRGLPEHKRPDHSGNSHSPIP